jgi:hypothetical protein
MQQDGFWRDGAVSLRTIASNARFRPPRNQLQLCIPAIGNPFVGSKGSTDASSLRGPEALNHRCSIIGNPNCEMRLLVGRSAALLIVRDQLRRRFAHLKPGADLRINAACSFS